MGGLQFRYFRFRGADEYAPVGGRDLYLSSLFSPLIPYAGGGKVGDKSFFLQAFLRFPFFPERCQHNIPVAWFVKMPFYVLKFHA